MKTIRTAIIGASALAVLSLAPFELAANARGLHGFHFSNRLHAGHHRAHGAGSFYGGFYGGGLAVVPPYAADTILAYPPSQIVYVPEPPQALGCRRSEQIVTVPAEAGGTRQIAVTRC